MKARSAKTLIDGSLLAITMVYLLTGLGVTHYRWIEAGTWGILTKNRSFNIHEALLAPFLILLSLHLLFRPITRIYLKTRKQKIQHQ
jgi:hypothetical protein